MRKRKSLFRLFFYLLLFFIFLLGLDRFRNWGLQRQLNRLEFSILGSDFASERKLKKISIFFDKDTKRAEIDNNLDSKKHLPVYFSIKNIGKSDVQPQVAVNEKDWLSNKSILKTALKDCPYSTGEELAICLFDFVKNNFYHYWPPYYSNDLLDSPVLHLNIFGYGFCSDISYVLSILAEIAGLKSRIVYLVGDHVVSEIFYNNKWHLFDADRHAFYRNSNGDIASLNELRSNLSLIGQKKSSYASIEKQKKEISTSRKKINYIYKDFFLENNKPKEEISYKLEPNEEIRFYYNWKKDWFWSDFVKEPPVYSNGLLISRLDSINNKKLWEELVKEIQLPYPILGSYIYAKDLCKKANLMLFSLDNENWLNAKEYCRNHVIWFNNVFPKGKEAIITYKYFIKLNNSSLINSLFIYTQFQVAPKSIPLLNERKNQVYWQNEASNDDKIKLEFVYKLNEK